MPLWMRMPVPWSTPAICSVCTGLVIGAQAQGDDADRRRGAALAGGDIDIVAAHRQVADGAQPSATTLA